MATAGHAWHMLKRVGMYQRVEGTGYGGTKNASWAPAWAVRLCKAFRNRRADVFEVQLTGRQLLSIGLRLAKCDEQLQRALTAAHRMGGDEAMQKLLREIVLA